MPKTYIIDGKEEESASSESVETFNRLCQGIGSHADPLDHMTDVGCTIEELDALIEQASRIIAEGEQAGNGPDEEENGDEVAAGVIIGLD